MYCPNCGRKISANSQFCPYCGIKIKSNLTNPEQQTSQRQSGYKVPPNSVKSTQLHSHKKMVWIILAVIIIIIAGGFGYHKYELYKQSPASVNLATTMPGHNWKSRYSFISGNYNSNHFSKHSISDTNGKHPVHVSYGKDYFEINQNGVFLKCDLDRIHNNKYYFYINKFKMQDMSFSGNTIRIGSVTETRHGDQVTLSDNKKSKNESLDKMMHSNNDGARYGAMLLTHKQFKIIKE